MTTKALTFRQALNILEEQFDSTYRGISTVKEMTTDLMSAISFEGENPEVSYADRNGKYMKQVGITLAKPKY